MLKKYSSPTHIAWVSDRDAIIDKHNGFAFDNMLFWYKIVSHGLEFAKIDPQFIFQEPEKEAENYYDELIRIPDYIAGSLASIDIENKENLLTIHDKHWQMFNNVYTNPMNQATLKVECKNEMLSVYNFKWIENNA